MIVGCVRGYIWEVSIPVVSELEQLLLQLHRGWLLRGCTGQQSVGVVGRAAKGMAGVQRTRRLMSAECSGVLLGKVLYLEKLAHGRVLL